MRVLFLAHRLPYPPDKGDKIRSFFELQAFAKHHEVDVFCFYDYEEDAQYEGEVRRYCANLYAEHLPWLSSRKNALVATIKGSPFSLGYFFSKSMKQRIDDSLARRNYDLIFVFSSSMAQYVERTSVPKIMDLVDVDSDKWGQYAERSSPPASWLWNREQKLLSKYEAEIVRTFAATLICTDPEAKTLRSIADAKSIRVLGNRVDNDYWNPKGVTISERIAALQPYVIFSGSMDYLPNVDAVTFFQRECLPHLRALVSQAKFVIVGRNPSKDVKKLEDDPAVIVTGSVPDIRPYLVGAYAAVAPLRMARGIQNKVLEALAMGVPTVTTSRVAAALPNELQSTVYVEDAPERMAAQIALLLRSRDDAAGMVARQKLLDHCGTAETERQLNEIVEQVVGKSLRSPELRPNAASTRENWAGKC